MPNKVKNVTWLVYGDDIINPPGGIVYFIPIDVMKEKHNDNNKKLILK